MFAGTAQPAALTAVDHMGLQSLRLNSVRRLVQLENASATISQDLSEEALPRSLIK
jgi:hypothetical protein